MADLTKQDVITTILDEFKQAILDAGQLSRERSMVAEDEAYKEAIEALEEL